MNKTENIEKYKSYLGNQNLKKSGVNVLWSSELIEEYIKCSQDPIYFNETYVKIVNVDDGLVNFKLYDYQKDMMISMRDNRYTIITTCRQAGKSTTTVGFILWYVLFNNDKTVALLANKGETAREILGRVQLAFEHLPKWIQQGVVEWNKGSFELENNSRVIASATSGSAIRGYSINLLFIDEAAFIENWDEFFTSVFPTISSGKTTKIVLVSTPNGLNHFYKLWNDAMESRNSYNPIMVKWNCVPGRDENWKKDTLSGMGNDIEKFSQEYECEFIGSSGTLITGSVLKSLSYINPIEKKDGLYQYKKPDKNKKYTIVVDVSRGKGLDYSAFQVIDITNMPYEQVCTYKNNFITPTDYADIIYRLSKLYNDATILVEINDIGGQISDLLFYEYECETLIHTESAGRNGKKISSGFGSNIDKGIRTTKNVKSIGCSILKLLIEQQQFILNDFETINELSRFSRKGSSYEAESGSNDDLVMCLVLFAWMTDQSYFKELTDINTLIKLREKTEEEIENDLTPFGFIVSEDLVEDENSSSHIYPPEFFF